jgi:hypothetical protein
MSSTIPEDGVGGGSWDDHRTDPCSNSNPSGNPSGRLLRAAAVGPIPPDSVAGRIRNGRKLTSLEWISHPNSQTLLATTAAATPEAAEPHFLAKHPKKTKSRIKILKSWAGAVASPKKWKAKQRSVMVFFGPKIGSKWSIFGRLDPPGDRVGDGRPQQSPGRAAGAGLPSSASSILGISRDI